METEKFVYKSKFKIVKFWLIFLNVKNATLDTILMRLKLVPSFLIKKSLIVQHIKILKLVSLANKDFIYKIINVLRLE